MANTDMTILAHSDERILADYISDKHMRLHNLAGSFDIIVTYCNSDSY